MDFKLFLFIIICAIFLALLEIQVEGGDGWAKNLPTWRIKNPFRKIINWPYITGYHVYLWILFGLLFHLPFFFGFSLTLGNEILILELLAIFLFIEDFFWFSLNPNWGIKKFFLEEIPWYAHKLLYFPINYWISLIVIIGLELLRNFIGN